MRNLELAAKLLRCRPLLVALTSALEEDDLELEETAVAVLRRWMLSSPRIIGSALLSVSSQPSRMMHSKKRKNDLAQKVASTLSKSNGNLGGNVISP